MMAYPGVWTPWAEVLCLSCHGQWLERSGPRREAGGWAEREVAEEAAVSFRCDRCRRPTVCRGWPEVTALAALRDRINDETEHVAGMEQTGGMCAAVSLDDCAMSVYSADERDDRFGVVRWLNDYRGECEALDDGLRTAEEIVKFLKETETC